MGEHTWLCPARDGGPCLCNTASQLWSRARTDDDMYLTREKAEARDTEARAANRSRFYPLESLLGWMKRIAKGPGT